MEESLDTMMSFFKLLLHLLRFCLISSGCFLLHIKSGKLKEYEIITIFCLFVCFMFFPHWERAERQKQQTSFKLNNWLAGVGIFHFVKSRYNRNAFPGSLGSHTLAEFY